MKIAILGTKGIPGHHGVEVVVDSLMPYLSAMGHRIKVYGYDSYSRNRHSYKGVQVETVSGSSHKNMEMISHMWNASWSARKEVFDIVHIHSTDPCLMAWIPKARHGLIASSHGQAYLRKKWSTAARLVSKLAERFFIRMPKVITSVSKPLADWYEQTYGRYVHYIPNGVNAREKPDASFLQKWHVTPGSFLFCSAGRIEKTKGIHTLLDAYKRLSIKPPLLIAGGGSGSDQAYYDQLKQHAPPGVSFLGFLTGDAFYSLYAYARIFVFPSEYEAMSMALLEGLSYGVPTVYSDIPENLAVASGLGYAFKVSNADDLADRIEYALTHENEASAIGRKARDYVQKHHDWKVIATQYDDIYRQMALSRG